MDRITVYCTYQGQKYRITVREGIDRAQLDASLREKLGVPDEYVLWHSGGSPWYPFVHDGDEFEYVKPRPHGEGVLLYGCPTANDVPGTVPACMLAAFEGFQHTDV